MRRRRIAIAGALGVAFLLLTALTQIGGVALLVSVWLARRPLRRMSAHRRSARILIHLAAFALAYGVITASVLPAAAPVFGRVALPCVADAGAQVAALTPLTCVLNRHYATPRVDRLLRDLGSDMAAQFPGTTIRYLDAGFPFIDGFPLLPHLSHDDGRKVDLAYFYRSAGPGTPEPAEPPSWIGYWAYEPPRPGEARPCDGRRSWLRWDFDWLQPAFARVEIDPDRTRAMLRWLIDNAGTYGVSRLLLEPHLQDRMGVAGGIVRFQGCGAARHDDHVHVSVQ